MRFRRRKELKTEEGVNKEMKYEVLEGKKFKLSEYKPFTYSNKYSIFLENIHLWLEGSVGGKYCTKENRKKNSFYSV